MCPLSPDSQSDKTQPVRIAPSSSNSGLDHGFPGPLLAVYRPRPINQALRWVLLLGGGLLIVGVLGYGSYLAFSSQKTYGWVPAIVWNLGWFVLGGIAILAWFVGLLGVIFGGQPVIKLYTQGLSIEKHGIYFLAWDNIDGISWAMMEKVGWTRSNRAFHYEARLYPATGRPMRLVGTDNGKKGITNLDELVRRIKANLYPGLLAELTRMFRSGVPLYFGPIIIDQTGFALRKILPLFGTRFVPWRSINRITVRSGHLLVELDDRKKIGGISRYHRIAVAKIPNLELLLQIIDKNVTR